MFFDRFTFAYWLKIGHPDLWITGMIAVLTALVTLLSVSIAAYLTYRYTKKHSIETHKTQVLVDRLQREISALEKVWELLAYTSMGERKKAIVRWTQNKKGGEERQYFYHFGCLRAFVTEELDDVFYTQHAGLFMPKNIRDQLFDLRRALMGPYFSLKNKKEISDDSLHEANNPEIIDALNIAHKQLHELLRIELEQRYRALLIQVNFDEKSVKTASKNR